MMLILLGPLVTRAQLLPQASQSGHTQNAVQHQTASEHHHDHRHHHGQQPQPAQDKNRHHASHSPLEHLAQGECGYCWLLVKSPAISSHGSATAWAVITAAPSPLAANRSQPYGKPCYINTPVRAPPVMV